MRRPTQKEKELEEKDKQEQSLGECEQAQEKSQLQERGKNMKQHTCHSAIGAHTVHDGQRSHSSPRVEAKE